MQPENPSGSGEKKGKNIEKIEIPKKEDSAEVKRIREEIRKKEILKRTEQAKREEKKKIEDDAMKVAELLVVVTENSEALKNEQWADVDRLIETAKENSEKGKEAKECLDNLTEAICKEMQENDDPVIADAVKKGVFSVDEILPKDLRGSGSEISEEVFEVAVPNKELRGALNLVDANRFEDGTIYENILTEAKKMAMGAVLKGGGKIEDLKIQAETLQYFEDEEKIIPVAPPEEKKEVIASESRREQRIPTKRLEKDHYVDEEPEREVIEGPAGESAEGVNPRKYERPFDLPFSELHNLFADQDQTIDFRTSYPEWYKNLPKEEREKVDIMIKIHNAAVHLRFFGNTDLGKCRDNPYIKEGISQKELGLFFDEEMQQVMHWMMNDLCELKPNEGGMMTLVYKTVEKPMYEFETDEEGKVIMEQVKDKDTGELLFEMIRNKETGELERKKDKNGQDIKIEKPKMKVDSEGNPVTKKDKNGKEILRRQIEGKAKYWLDNIDEMKDNLAIRLAQKRYAKDHPEAREWDIKKLLEDGVLRLEEVIQGEKKGTLVIKKEGKILFEVTLSDRQKGAQAWEYWYATWGSSLADEYRILGPTPGLVSDKIRTLNALAKFLKKSRTFAKGELFSREALEEAEMFGGAIAVQLNRIMMFEHTFGPIDGRKTLQQKIVDGEFRVFADQLCFGMSDVFTDIFQIRPNGEASDVKVGISMAEAFYEGREFAFKKTDADAIPDIRDVQEVGQNAFEYLMGMKPLKKGEWVSWIAGLKTTIGEANDKKVFSGKYDANGKEIMYRIFSFTKSPEFIAMCLLNSLGVESERLSSSCFYLAGATNNVITYNDYIKGVVDAMGFDKGNINVDAIKKYLGYQSNWLKSVSTIRHDRERFRTWMRKEGRLMTGDRKAWNKKLDELEQKILKEKIKLLDRYTGVEDQMLETYKKAARRAAETNNLKDFERIMDRIESLLKNIESRPVNPISAAA